MLYLLDTDHVSLLQRGNPHVLARLAQTSLEQRAVTVITVMEQLQGRLAVIHQARLEADVARGCERLQETLAFYTAIRVVPYDAEAQRHFAHLRRQRVRIGAQDLRIAAIGLSRQATVVTRNSRDFTQVPGLYIVDWSIT